jgi:Tol biopolymer transport system component/predicted Ser/Thr protein kinase
MTLAAGGRIGSYEVVGPLGAGGMGEVYQARDTRLGRDVALKILPDVFARDDDRLARFEREARALAALNHSNIAQLYGIEDSGGRPALVMEFVPGRTLEQILANGEPMAAAEVIAIARQIADALEAAHDCGIVHRDLKPANIKVRDDGAVKVLDFGLARAFDPHVSSPGAPALPTVTSPAFTAMGVVLGTAAYMAPEQARGQTVDKRADIWAFGVVLFEMLSGRRLFAGETVSDTLAAVLRQDVPWDALPASTPASLRRLLKRCLERDPKKRLRDIGDAWPDHLRDEEEPVREPRGTPPRRSPWRAAAWIASVIVTAGAAAAAGWFARTPPEPPVRRSALLTEDGMPPLEAAISPNGRFIAYATAEKVWLQSLSEGRAREVPGGGEAHQLFWSPDSAWLGFQARGQLWKSAVGGSSASIAIARVPADFTTAGSAAWLPDGRIVFTTGSSGLYEVPADGGTPKVALALDPAKETDFHEARSLPGTNAVLFVVHPVSAAAPYTMDVYDGRTRKQVFTPPADIRTPFYSPTGHVLYVHDGSLWAIAFDAASLETRGNPFLVEAGAASPSVAADGTLVMLPSRAGAPQELVWLERSGKASEPLSTVNAPIGGIRLSPDGTRAVASVSAGGNADVWLFDTRRVAEQRLTREREPDTSPAWLSNGRIAYSCDRRVCLRAADGSTGRQVILDGPVHHVGSTPDGARVLVSQAGPTSLSDIFMIGAPAGTGRPSPLTPVIATDRQQRRSDVSPDGKYIVYESNEPGRYEIYASRFPSGEGKWDVSRGAGTWPRWSAKGDRIFFADEQSRIVEVDVQADASFAIGGRRVALAAQQFGADPVRDGFDRSLDGQRFLVARAPLENRRRASMFIVENWVRLYRELQ